MAKIITTKSLSDYTRSIGGELWKTGRSVYLAGLGVVALAEEETRGAFDRLVTRGESLDKDDAGVLERATGTMKNLGRKVEDGVQQTVEAAFKRAGVPGHKEIRTLTRRVEELTEEVEQLGATG